MKIFLSVIIFGFMGSISYALPPGAEKWPDECNAGKAGPCYYQGLRLYHGDKIKKDYKAAAFYAGKACSLGIGEACFLVGKLYYSGAENFPQNKKESFPYLNAACTKNQHKKLACYYAASALLETGGDAKMGLALANKGCMNKESYACTIITDAFIKSNYGLKKDDSKIYEYAVRGCDLNDNWSCYTAGIQISSGYALGNDYKKAADFFLKACDGGYKSACYSAGKLSLMVGNLQKSFPYLKESCQTDNVNNACRDAGYVAVELTGPSSSRPWYQKGCEAGDEESCRYIRDLNSYESQNAAYEAQQAKKAKARDEVSAFLNSGNYSKAMEIATYGYGSRAEAARVVLTAERNGHINSIDPFYFSFLEQWLAMDHPQANAIVRRESLKKRVTETSSRGLPSVSSGAKEPSLSDQFWANEKARYKRDLDWANRGGNPAGFESKIK